MSETPSPHDRPSGLITLAHAKGVATAWHDWKGSEHQVPADTLRAVLAALDAPAGDDAEIEASLDQLNSSVWDRALPPCVVLRSGTEQRVTLHLPTSAARPGLELEDGSPRELPYKLSGRGTQVVDDVELVEVIVTIPGDLPLGYHRLLVDVEGSTDEMPVIVAPHHIRLPNGLGEAGEQWWGLMTQLYAMRSERSWGLGDIADLADVGAWAAGLGADFVLVNPVHAAEPIAPMEPSPYLPTSRRFGNPIYVRVEDVPEVAHLSAAERQLVEWHADDARRYLSLDYLERDAVWASKEAALRLVFRQPRSIRRERAFNVYCEGQGKALRDFATWNVIAGEHGADWTAWPEELRDPDGAAVDRFRHRHETEVEFHCWLQWVLDGQLRNAHQDLLENGMRLGVVHDLAVGVHRTGADTWMLGEALAAGVTVGAPPDQYNQRGQNWSQPPWRPDGLAELGYQPYREMVRQALRAAGGLRIDHIIGLFRLWWIPDGADPSDGTYVRLDHEAMIGILLLEAHRAQAVLIGEDLGTVEPWVRDYLKERGVLGTSILWFERNESGPLPPEEYRELALSTVTTHDLPPTAGYLRGEHVKLREALGLLTGDAEEERAQDEAARDEVLAVLIERGLLGADDGVFAQVKALHGYLALTPSKLLAVSVSDLAQDRRIINQPGTADEYPNWRVPLAGPEGRPVLLDDLVTWRAARQLARSLARRVGRSSP